MFIRLDTEGLSIEEKEGLFEKGLKKSYVVVIISFLRHNQIWWST